jgi:hypothetical protein
MATYSDFATYSAPAGSAPTVMVGDKPAACLTPIGIDRVGRGLPPRITDEEREVAIKRAGELVEWFVGQQQLAYKRWAAFGNFIDKADSDSARTRADHARVCMEALIKGRSQAQIQRLEAERGLT